MATENTATQEPELEVHELDDGTVKVVDPSVQVETPADGDDDDAAHSATPDAEGEDGATLQEELAEAADDDEREAIRERRRKERKDRKQRAQEREATLRRELTTARQESQALAERLNILEGKTSGSELAQLDGAISEAGRAADSYKTIIAEATNRSDGAAVADATEKMIAARNRETELKNVRKSYTQPQRQQPQGGTQAPATPPPQLVALAQSWMAKHDWYNPKGGDPDSEVAITLDRQLAREGFNPMTAEYWDELSARVRKYMPHRAQEKGGKLPVDSTRKPGKSVVTGSSRESPATGGREFVLSAERVKALKDAGYWNDPKARADMIRSYREHDRKIDAAKKS